MAMPRRIKVEFSDVFAHGLFMVGEVEPMRDFDRSTKEVPVQAVDEESGLPVWTVECVDADPDATKATRSLSVRILAKVQPVPPESPFEGPFRPVGLEGLVATGYIDDKGMFPRIAWSYRATALTEPASKSKPAPKSTTGTASASTAAAA